MILLIARPELQIVGACWSRLMNDYGHIDDDTPSLALNVAKKFSEHILRRRLEG